MNEDLNRLKDIKVENYIWIIYIGIIVLSWYANSKEKDFIINKNENSKKEYQALMILIFTILLFIYYYFSFPLFLLQWTFSPKKSAMKLFHNTLNKFFI